MSINVDEKVMALFEYTVSKQNNVTFEKAFAKKITNKSFFILANKMIYFMELNGCSGRKQLLKGWSYSTSLFERHIEFFRNQGMIVSSYHADAGPGRIVVFNPTGLWFERKKTIIALLTKQMEMNT